MTYATSGAVLMKAGANVSTAFTTEIDAFIGQAESVVNNTARHDFSGAYSTLDAGLKLILEQVTTDLAAIYAIQYDMSQFTSRAEAGNMIDVLWASANRGLTLLKDQQVEDFIK